MEKYLVTIEFRYYDAPESEHDCKDRDKKITIGVYDTFEEACVNGNNLLVYLPARKTRYFSAGI